MIGAKSDRVEDEAFLRIESGVHAPVKPVEATEQHCERQPRQGPQPTAPTYSIWQRDVRTEKHQGCHAGEVQVIGHFARNEALCDMVAQFLLSYRDHDRRIEEEAALPEK